MDPCQKTFCKKFFGFSKTLLKKKIQLISEKFFWIFKNFTEKENTTYLGKTFWIFKNFAEKENTTYLGKAFWIFKDFTERKIQLISEKLLKILKKLFSKSFLSQKIVFSITFQNTTLQIALFVLLYIHRLFQKGKTK
ncbi:MAG: hypothetical protein J6M35_10545 [Clostridia bacterium]|nr:hypothetical protein [Clostridia bacterium]